VKKWPKILKLFSIAGILVGLALAGFRLSAYLMPVTKKDLVQFRFHSVKFYDRQGALLQEVLSDQHGRTLWVSLDEVSPYFLDAMIAAEDKRFFRHGGVDVLAVLRAVWQNLSSWKVVSGGSTITLQLARLLDPGKRTLLKKLHEAFYAHRMEAGLTKYEILTQYINRIPMGGNLYGVESASRAFFGVPAKELTLAQATFLASIPKSPKRLNPYRNPEAIKSRQKYVLDQMAANGSIESSRIDRVLKEELRLRPEQASFFAPHFVFHLMQQVPEGTREINTTIDSHLQRMVHEQIKRVLGSLKKLNVTNAAVLLLDNASGDVLAYVGSADYFNEASGGQNDGVWAIRQPGSTLKPFLYLQAMESGFHPATLISDLPSHYRMPNGIYSPRNYSESFRGPVRLREALANSLNVPAVRTLAKIGVEDFLQRLHEYGFGSLSRNAEYYGLGMALGGGDVTLFELTRAYLTLARMGRITEVREIIRDDPAPGKETSILRPALNYLIADILSDRFARTAEFGFDSVLNLPFDCAVKTGTSFRFCDNWAVGYTTDYTLGVWVGNFDHRPMQKVSGISGAGPLFASIMLALYKDGIWPEPFVRPEGLVKTRVCALSGKRPGPHCPTVIEELVPENALKTIESCKMHRLEEDRVTTRYPSRYHRWAESLGLEDGRLNSYSNDFEITHPRSGARYFRMSNLPLTYQSIQVELDTPDGAKRVQWYLNGNPLRVTEKQHRFLWQISPGQHTLSAVSAFQGESHESSVHFSVQ
jgi:penicillin-binding protein 1C